MIMDIGRKISTRFSAKVIIGLVVIGLVGVQAYAGKEGQTEIPREEAIPDFAVFSSDPEVVDSLDDVIAKSEREFSVITVKSLQEAAMSKAEVLILVMDRLPFSQTDVSGEILDGLKDRKTIGIGYGAAQVFGKLGLEIRGGACAHNPRDGAPKINIETNMLTGGLGREKPITAFEVSSPPKSADYNFGMYIPVKSHLNLAVDVIARWEGDENYAPIVRQGNHIMIGLAAPVRSWTPVYRGFFSRLAGSLHSRAREPFAPATWPLTKAGTYEFKLARGRSKEELPGRTFYFQFTSTTTFLARLYHKGSKNIMLHFMGGKARKWVRKDAEKGEPLEVSIGITEEDIEAIGAGYWKLSVVNFDREHTANCSIRIEY